MRAVYDGQPAIRWSSAGRSIEAAGELRGDQGARELLARFNVRRWDARHLADATDVDTLEEPEAL